jgi:hypothetical protein
LRPGVLLGLGTAWRLAQYYWVRIELVVTMTVFTALVFVLRPRVNQAAAEALEVALAELARTGNWHGRRRGDRRSRAALLVLLTTTILTVYKPWGQTRFRRR